MPMSCVEMQTSLGAKEWECLYRISDFLGQTQKEYTAIWSKKMKVVPSGDLVVAMV